MSAVGRVISTRTCIGDARRQRRGSVAEVGVLSTFLRPHPTRVRGRRRHGVAGAVYGEDTGCAGWRACATRSWELSVPDGAANQSRNGASVGVSPYPYT